MFDLEELISLIEEDGFSLALYAASHISNALSQFSGPDPTPAELESLKGTEFRSTASGNHKEQGRSPKVACSEPSATDRPTN